MGVGILPPRWRERGRSRDSGQDARATDRRRLWRAPKQMTEGHIMPTPLSTTVLQAEEPRSSPLEPMPRYNRLIDPISKQELSQELLGDADPGGQPQSAGLLPLVVVLDEVDRVITTLDRHYPDITLKNASREITSSDYTLES